MGDTGSEARAVAIRSMTVGGQPYWAAADVAAYLDSAAGNWATVGDVVPQSIAYRLSQLSVQLTAEAILQHDWWAGHRFGMPSPAAPASSLPGGVKIGSAVKYELGERHLYFSAAGVTGFLHAEADRYLREHERLLAESPLPAWPPGTCTPPPMTLTLNRCLSPAPPSGESRCQALRIRGQGKAGGAK